MGMGRVGVEVRAAGRGTGRGSRVGKVARWAPRARSPLARPPTGRAHGGRRGAGHRAPRHGSTGRPGVDVDGRQRLLLDVHLDGRGHRGQAAAARLGSAVLRWPRARMPRPVFARRTVPPERRRGRQVLRDGQLVERERVLARGAGRRAQQVGDVIAKHGRALPWAGSAAREASAARGHGRWARPHRDDARRAS